MFQRRNAAQQPDQIKPIKRLPEVQKTPLQRAYDLFEYVCKRLAQSTWFSALTTILTIYALFGDDIRLLLTSKPADEIFDCITIASMIVFGIEILVCSVGKYGYFLGFFFFLDLLSTCTLLLDITSIAEDLFGDTVSRDNDDDEQKGSAGADDSAEAARAARMSRAGTKAGRVVRLIRLMRLIRLYKAFKKSKASYQAPGENWEEDDYDDQKVERESDVSKKLSEMTTRRVIILVLTIMLGLPFFQPEMYRADLDSSAQYGVNMLYRRLHEDLVHYDLLVNPNGPERQAYIDSRKRMIYEDDFVLFVYYHNWFCHLDDVPTGKASPRSSFGKLFWMGGSPPTGSMNEYFLPSYREKGWDARWNGAHWDYYQCNLPPEAQQVLTEPWSNARECGRFAGFSLIAFKESSVVCPSDLRYQERKVVKPNVVSNEERMEFIPMFVFDRRSGSHMEAGLNTGQTFFICLLLGVGAMTFSNDANKLVLIPIERMISKLEKIRNNPLEAMTIGDEEHHREQVAASKKKQPLLPNNHATLTKDLLSTRSRMKRWMMKINFYNTSLRGRHSQQVSEPMETVVLEKTIIKIGSLLALGFGEAGAEIIGQNMKGGDSSALNAMIPGRKVEALFGFCDIRNFTDATEVLQDQVMVFVNRIAGVVHSCINEFFGSPNKNIGDAFLLVWRLSGLNPRKQQRLADMSLVSFVKIIAQINKSPLLAEYRSHPKLVKRLPNYRVRMGFGLHSGWAIEGAIGSEFKIDASYLSPNVNMAARLESVTKSYGCLILISHALIELCSEPIAQECRLIDHVSMVGRQQPFKLYTMDLDDLALEVDKSAANAPQTKNAKFKQRYERQRKKNERWSDDYNMYQYFESDIDIKTMRSKFTTEFFCRFNMAYLNYEAGNWAVAKSMLEATRFLLATEDGPSAALLRFMKPHADTGAPKGWPGYRILNEK
mmetsp:Transcript_156891/g.273078  ORF Transcript_156891/g.273078 Transcript_156891/m.273078 type:complete len:942 (+) Transcript_156891:140-2965(+)